MDCWGRKVPEHKAEAVFSATDDHRSRGQLETKQALQVCLGNTIRGQHVRVAAGTNRAPLGLPAVREGSPNGDRPGPEALCRVHQALFGLAGEGTLDDVQCQSLQGVFPLEIGLA